MWGASDFEAEEGKLISKVNSPEAVEMTDWYVKLIREGGSPTWASATWSSCGGELGAGTAAIMLDATNNAFSQTIPENAAEAENLVIAPIPLPDGKTDADTKSQLWTCLLYTSLQGNIGCETRVLQEQIRALTCVVSCPQKQERVG